MKHKCMHHAAVYKYLKCKIHIAGLSTQVGFDIHRYSQTSRRIFHRPTIMIKSLRRRSAMCFFSCRMVSYFFQKKCLVNPYRVLCPKTSRIRTSLFSSSQICKGLSSEGQDVFVMTFPTPLLTSHIHP